MTIAFKRIVVSLLLLLAQSQPCLASDPNSIVWLEDNVSIKGLKKIDFYPVIYDTHNRYVSEMSPVISETIQGELEHAGIAVNKITNNTPPTLYALETRIVLCQPGNVGGRWVGFGGGASVCILRTRIISSTSGKAIGEVIVANDIASGGLFSIGAEKYVPKGAAKQTAEEIAGLLGLNPGSGTGTIE